MESGDSENYQNLRRDCFALYALAGLLANPEKNGKVSMADQSNKRKSLANEAVSMADLLIEALDKK